MTHTILLKFNRLGLPDAEFECHEPDTAWCRQNAVGPGEEPSENPLHCWFTVLAFGPVPWGKLGIYIGSPTELRSGEIEFTKIEGPEDFCVWHYKGDPGGHEYPLDRDTVSEGKREKDA